MLNGRVESDMSILIDIGNIRCDKRKTKTKKEIEVSNLKDMMSLEFDVQPFILNLELQGDEDSIVAEGSFKMKFKTKCSKCLKEIEIEQDIQFKDLFIPEGKASKDYEDRSEGNLLSIKNNKLDILESIEASIAESLEISYLCKSNCPGLCPICGKRLAEGQCACEKDEVDPRLEVLKKLKFN